MLWLPDELIIFPSYTPFRGHRNLILLPSKERIALAFVLITLTLLSASQETSNYAISLLHNELYNFKLFVSMQGTWVLSKTKGIGSMAAHAIVSLKLRHHEDSVSVTMDLASSVGSSLTLNLSAAYRLKIFQSAIYRNRSTAREFEPSIARIKRYQRNYN